MIVPPLLTIVPAEQYNISTLLVGDRITAFIPDGPRERPNTFSSFAHSKAVWLDKKVSDAKKKGFNCIDFYNLEL